MIWQKLYDRHTKDRMRAKESLTAVRHVLQKFRSKTGLPQGFSAQWASELNRESGVVEWFMADRIGVVPLKETADLADVRLTLLALADGRANHLRQFTAMLEGKSVRGGTPWTVAIHLADDRADDEGDRQGTGACGHAAWHCHVGPDLNAKPKVRVPLPGLKPADALSWLLTTLVADMEPARWPAQK